MATIVTDDSLNKSAKKYRQELLLLAVLGLEKVLPYFTLRPGIRYSETVGTLDGPFEYASYNGQKNADSDFTINGRTLYTFLGSCVKELDPNELVQTIYGSNITSGKGLEGVDINKKVVALAQKKLSESLMKSIFKAERKANGKKTMELFNGIDTITTDEITKGNIAVSKGNYMELTDEINATSAVDMLKTIYRSVSDELREIHTYMYVPWYVYDAYCDDYKATTGAIAYNTQFNQVFLEGSSNCCTLLPLVAKRDSPYMHITEKKNMLLGCCQIGDYEKIEVRRGDNPFLMQFISTMFFGTQLESLDKSRLLVAKFKS